MTDPAPNSSKDLSEALVEQATILGRRLGATGVLAFFDQVVGLTGVAEVAKDPGLILAIHSEKQRPLAEAITRRVFLLPKADLTRQAQIYLGVMAAASQGHCHAEDIIVCLAGPPNDGPVDTLHLLRLTGNGAVFCPTCHEGLDASVPAQVFNTLLTLVVELAQEGREGKPIGTIFVLGDHEAVLQLSRQAVLNPFAGYPEDSLSILNQEMKETIREFAALDGAFILKGNGALLAAGRYLAAPVRDLDLPQGMGARHAAAAGITALTNAVALTISESSGAVTVFRQGRIITTLEKALPGLLPGSAA